MSHTVHPPKPHRTPAAGPRTRSLLLGAAAALAMLCQPAAAGPLTGQSLGMTGGLSSAVFTVGSGVELTQFAFLEFDFTEGGALSLRTNGTYGGITFTSAFAYTFTDINGTIADIVDVSLVSLSGVGGFDASQLSFTADSLTLDMTGSVWGRFDEVLLQITFAPSAASVPEPSSLALAGLAIAGAAGSLRRRTPAPRVTGA